MSIRSWLGLVACAFALPAAQAGSKVVLPPAAEAAVRGLFPAGTIEPTGVEREAGVEYYEVTVREGAVLREVEVTRDGMIGEIEGQVALAELPPAARTRILEATGGATPRAVELHEVRGTPQGGTFVPVHPPLVLYEARWIVDGKHKEIVVTADGGAPPRGVAADRDDDGDDAEED